MGVSLKEESGAEATEYRGFVLRLWREGPLAPWRAHLRSISSGEEHRFAGLAALLSFLEQETEGSAPAETRSGPPEGASRPARLADQGT